jgi:hypothetical protein
MYERKIKDTKMFAGKFAGRNYTETCAWMEEHLMQLEETSWGDVYCKTGAGYI